MLFCADRTPLELQGLLEDLRSRLGSTTVFHLPKFDEAGLAGLLRLRAARRGLLLSDEVVAYVLARAPRSSEGLMGLLDALDHAALARGRAITIPLINELKLLSPDR